MSLYVQKYGGTSVGSVERIQGVAAKVATAHKEGHQIVLSGVQIARPGRQLQLFSGRITRNDCGRIVTKRTRKVS